MLASELLNEFFNKLLRSAAGNIFLMDWVGHMLFSISGYFEVVVEVFPADEAIVGGWFGNQLFHIYEYYLFSRMSFF